MTDNTTGPTLGAYDEKQIASMNPQQRNDYARHLLMCGHGYEEVEKRFGNFDSASPSERARAEKIALTKDAAWIKRYLDGGHEERKKLQELDHIIHGIKGHIT